MRAALGARGVSPSASALGEEVFEQDRRRTSVDVARAAQLGLARGVTLVVEPDGKPERLAGDRETAHALGLMALLATQSQGQTDEQCVDLLFARYALELREIFHYASPHECGERPSETVRVISDGEADAAIADVKRQVSHR